ncbi:restriction endonuclease subunit S [Bacillus cereus]|nr:restriction endonuclease subunit S [Bacillus cereus]
MLSKVEESYKETKIGRIPADWKVRSLNEVLEVMTDYVANGSFQSLRENVNVYDEEEFAYYVRLYDLRLGIGHSSQKYVDQASYNFLNKSSLYENEILIANIGANVGEVLLMPRVNKPATIAPNMILMRVNDKNDFRYIYYYLSSMVGQREIANEISGSGQPKLNKTGLKKVFVSVPNLAEQRRIAGVLSLIDEVIQKTEDIIKQTEKVKKGLMQQLLTKGIGHTKFKKTEIGDIPKDWECKKLGEILEVCQYGLSDALSLEQKGFPVLRMGNLQNGIIDTGNLKYLDVPEGNVKDFLLENGDILFNRTNSEELVGKTSIFQEDFPCSFASYLIRLRPKKNKVDSNFLNYYMNSGAGQNRIRRYIALGVSQCNISASNLKKVYIPIPNIEEQKKIVNIVCSSDKKIEVEKRRLSRLQRLKQGLMPSLLMGKVRVKVDEVEVTQV